MVMQLVINEINKMKQIFESFRNINEEDMTHLEFNKNLKKLIAEIKGETIYKLKITGAQIYGDYYLELGIMSMPNRLINDLMHFINKYDATLEMSPKTNSNELVLRIDSRKEIK